MDAKQFAKYIDHTLVTPNAVSKDYDKLVLEAKKYGFYSVVVPTRWVSYAKLKLRNTDVKVGQVVGFPLGYNSTKSKMVDVEGDYVDEIDMVMNISEFLNGDLLSVKMEVNAIKEHFPNAVLKVIISTPHLSDKQIAEATKLISGTKADWIKTCTGWEDRGVTLHDIFIINHYKRDDLKVKASGKINDIEFAMELIHSGASRLGTSNGVELLRQFEADTFLGGEELK